MNLLSRLSLVTFLLLIAPFAKAQVIISEFMANNVEGILDGDGNREDWIEVKNSSLAAVDLAGWYLTDNVGQLRKWAFPSKLLQPGQYLLVFASNKDRRNPAAQLHTNFKLDGGGEYLALTRGETSGATTVVQFWNPYPPQAADVSYGLSEAGTAIPYVGPTTAIKWRKPDSTTGPAMGTTWRGGNEPFTETGWSTGVAALGNGNVPVPDIIAKGTSPNWSIMHRYNTTETSLTYDTGPSSRFATTTNAAFLASSTDTSVSPLKRTGVLNFVGTENDQFLIPANAVYDVTSPTVCFWMKANLPTGSGNSGAMLWDRRAGNGTGAGIVIVQQDDGKIFIQANNGYCTFASPASVSDNQWHHIAVTFNTAVGQPNTLFIDGVQAATANNSANWGGAANGWVSSQAIEIGRSHDPYWKRYTGLMDDIRFYNRHLTPTEIAQIAGGADTTNGTGLFSTTGVHSADVTTSLSTMVNSNPTAYVRIPFTISDVNAISGVMLTMRAVDGYVAWINGIQVASYNSPASPTWNSAALSTDGQDPGRFRVFAISVAGGGLQNGTNILAIQVMNNTTAEPNVLVRPTLEGLSAVSGVSAYFNPETPGAANSAPLSALGPHVANSTKNPTPPVGGGASAPLTITSKVSSTINAVSTVQVAYRIMWGVETLVTMVDNGIAPDLFAGDKIYTANIPTTGITAGQMIRWRIVAKDSANTTTTDPLFIDLDGIAGQDTDQYYGTVAPDAGYTTGLPVLHWFVETPANADTVSPGTRASVFFLGKFYDYVFVNLHGQSTQGFPKKSYNLNFNKDNRFKWKEGEKEIRSMNFLSNYADKSKLRNTLAWAAWADSKHAASHFAQQLHVRRATSSEAMQFFSLADMVEDGNEEYLERCGLDKDGALYKMYNSLEGSTAPGAEKKTREFEDNSDLQALVTGINSSRTTSQRRQYLYDNVNVPALINFCVVHSLIANTDWGHKNYYVYRDSVGTGEWFALPWDQDLSFGHSWWGAQNYFDDEIHSQGTFPSGGGGNHLMSLVYGVPELNDMFVRRSRTLMDQILISAVATNGTWDNRVTSTIDIIDPPAGPPPTETTIFDGAATPCKWLVPAAGNGGLTLTPGAGVEQWTNYTEPVNIANWTTGTTGVGYDNAPDYLPLIGSNTGAQMFNINATCYVRVSFNIPDAAALANIGTLFLGMKYEDGFRAYLNGVAVAGDQDQDATMTSSPGTAIASGNPRDEAIAVQFATTDISTLGIPALRIGPNVLAVHCLNAGAGSSDILMVPKLTYFPPNSGPASLTDADRELQKWGWWVDGNATQQFGGVLDAATHDHGPRKQAMRILNNNPNPPQTSQTTGHETGNSTFPFLTGRRQYLYNNLGALGIPASQPASPTLVIEDVDFNPSSANQDDEYFVIRNTSGAAVDLSSWKLTGAVDYTFPAGTVIPAYTTGTEHIGRLHVSRSPAAFRVRTTGATGGQYRLVVGPYDGSMSARGEIIELRRPDNSLLMTQTWTAAPTAAQNQLRVTELNYAPAGPSPAESTAILNVSAEDFEYIELINTGGTTLNLAGARFTKGIEFAFPLGATLAAGARIVLVSNEDAFTLRYGAAGATIGGQYIGNLSNSGDTLRIVDAQGEEILDFHYEPSWYPQTNGGGYTLVTRNTSPGWADYGTPSAPLPLVWAMSAGITGTPGAGDTDNANGFDGWRFNHWTLGEVTTVGALVTTTDDADGDGLTNFAEYAYGKNPRTHDNKSLSTAGIANVSGTNYPTITFTRRHLAADVTWAVQESTNLTVWAATTVLINTVPLGNGLEQVTYRSATAASSTPRYFKVVATK